MKEELKCDGNCLEDDGEHSGEVVPVIVWGKGWSRKSGFHFNYCLTAIEKDRRRGFIVEVIEQEEEKFFCLDEGDGKPRCEVQCPFCEHI